jgi:predicted nucleotidyltransferase
VREDLAHISAKLRGILRELRSKYGVGRLRIFGSHARGQASETSGLYFLVEFDRRVISLVGFVGIEQEIGNHLGLKTDLVERRALRPEIEPRVLSEARAV